MSPDIFNMVTDRELRGIPWVLKNMDDLLIIGRNISEWVKRIIPLLNVCLKINMKLSLKKMQLEKLLYLEEYQSVIKITYMWWISVLRSQS